MRNDITYGIRDAEILDTALGVFFIEVVLYSYFIGKIDVVYGGVFFLSVWILTMFFRSFAKLFLTLFVISSTFIIYSYLIKHLPQDRAYIFTAIAFFIITMIHINSYFYFHEPIEEDDNELIYNYIELLQNQLYLQQQSDSRNDELIEYELSDKDDSINNNKKEKKIL
jgi:hypothetical protein